MRTAMYVMATCMVAAAYGSPLQCFFLSFPIFFLFFTTCAANIQYTRPTLLGIGNLHQIPVLYDFHHRHNIRANITRSPGSPWIVVGSERRHRQRRERKQIRHHAKAKETTTQTTSTEPVSLQCQITGA